MLRKIAIGLAAATFAMGGSALSASTDHGAAGAPSAGKVSGGGGQYGSEPSGGNISGGSGQYGGEGRHVMRDRYRHDHYGYGYRSHRHSYGGSCWR
jgi:hypothetical protein